jgi:hypothetical protein
MVGSPLTKKERIMTNLEIQNRLSQLVKEERKITQEILQLLLLALEKKTYLELGYPSLFEWLVKGFGYSNAAAYRRIEAARLLQALPEVAEKLEKGDVNLSVLAKAQTAFRAEEKAGRPVTVGAKRELVEQLEGKSQAQAESKIREVFPEAQKREAKRVVNASCVRVSLNLSPEAARNLARVRELLSHKFPQGTDGELVAHALEFLLEKTDPLRRTSAAEAVRVRVHQKAQGGCEYADPATGKVCGSRYQVQVDHIVPRALGGSDQPENLRLLCRQHNLHEAERILGADTMRPYWRSA